MSVPFQDLHKQYLSIKDEIDSAITSVIEESAFVRGKHVEGFESDFSNLIGIKNTISCANGTDAIFIAIKALGVQPGDEVIVPAHTWISTSEVVTLAGAKVVFCDTNLDSFNIDTEDLERKITKNTVGIIPVHLYGQPCDIGKVIEIAKSNNLWVVEDCAQSHLAEFNNQKVGTFGDAATFSFYPGKNLGAMGDAGCIVTNNDKLNEKMACLARHGGLTKGQHIIEGLNSRMDGIQAAILSVKIKYIEEWTTKRQEIGKLYEKYLSKQEGIILPSISSFSKHVWHLYVIKTDKRDQLREYLSESGISTVINYQIALPFLEAYSYLNHSPEDFPNAFENQSKVLSLPIFPEMTEEQVVEVSNAISQYFNEK